MLDKIKRYIGPRKFYQYVFSMAIPLGFQQLISSCMGIVDSLMVSWIGQVTAVGTGLYRLKRYVHRFLGEVLQELEFFLCNFLVLRILHVSKSHLV